MLGSIINSDGGDYRGAKIPCDCGGEAKFVDYRWKEVITVLSPISIKRAYYYDERCNVGVILKDKDIDIAGTSFSPGVRRMIGRLGAKESFKEGREDILELAGIEINTKEVERISEVIGVEIEEMDRQERELIFSGEIITIGSSVPKMYICMDGTGIPVVKGETINRRGKGEDGEAKTREVKVGCVFTQTSVDGEGNPVRDEDSTSYAGAIETSEEFGIRIYSEALRRGVQRAEQVIIIGDGAVWIWNISSEHFYGAIEIVDLYHAKEHIWDLGKLLFGVSNKRTIKWSKTREKELENGEVELVLDALKGLNPVSEKEKERVMKEASYFEKNKERMRYGRFRKAGLFYGSGVVEAGCKSVVGYRCKQSGMHWTVRGANAILALRMCQMNNRWEDFWDKRRIA